MGGAEEEYRVWTREDVTGCRVVSYESVRVCEGEERTAAEL